MTGSDLTGSRKVSANTYVVVAFWALVLFFGVPIWWRTTTVHREAIPLDEMQDWASGKICRPVFPLHILVETPPAIPASDADQLIQGAQHTLDDLNDFYAHHLRLRRVLSPDSAAMASAWPPWLSWPSSSSLDAVDADVALRIQLQQSDTLDTPSPVAEIYPPHSDTLLIRYPSTHAPRTPASTAALASFIASEVQALFIEEKATIAYILSTGENSSQTTGLQGSANSGSTGGCNGETATTTTTTTTTTCASNGGPRSSAEQWQHIKSALPPSLAEFITHRAEKSFKYAATYHLSFTLVTPGAAPSAWGLEEALREYMQPLLDVISPISKFSVDSQVQNYAEFSGAAGEPVFDEGLGAWTLRTEDLSGFVNAAEWPLNPSIGGDGDGPTIHFIVYVPAAEQSPLVIKESLATRWLIPRWGGVVILNLPASELSNNSNNNNSGADGNMKQNPKYITPAALQPALSTFSHQLLTLLGAPSSLYNNNNNNNNSSLPLRLQTLIRIYAATLFLSASATMGSLARLSTSLPNTPIPPAVATAITHTLTHLSASCALLRQGRFAAALARARAAEAAGEEGFFERRMVGQAYFPEEHKIAVYAPYLGPVGVPLVLGLVREVVRLVRGWRGAKKGEEEDEGGNEKEQEKEGEGDGGKGEDVVRRRKRGRSTS